MNTTSLQVCWVIGLAAGLGLAALGCGDDVACGPGSTEQDGQCVAAIGACGAGTSLKDGKCVADCEAGQSWDGTKCVSARQCAPGTTLAGDSCVPQCENDQYWNGEACADVPACAAGTAFDYDAGACAPTSDLCAAGTHFEDGQCVPDATQCGAGTHLDGEVCVPDTPPAADVEESAEPQGEAVFDLPSSGASLVLGGTVDEPEDLDGDEVLDPDYDRFTFEAEAGTWLRLHATSDGAAHPALVVLSEARDSEGYPLYSRYSINPLGLDTAREVYLPRAGKYSILVSDYNHVVADLYGWGMLPVGGSEFTYRVNVENLGTPAPTAISTPDATESGTLVGGALQFFRLEALQQHDARELTHLGLPQGHLYSDVFGALMVFGPAGGLLRETVAYSTDGDAEALFAATTPGDHLVVVDHLMTIGTRLDWELKVAKQTPTNCGVSNCGSGALAAAETRLLRWDLAAGDLFAAGLALSSTATTTIEADLLDEGMSPLADTSSATSYGPAKAMRYATGAERVYLRVAERNGEVVSSYTLDARVTVTPLLSSGVPGMGLAVVEMPADTYENAGYAHFVGVAGKVVVSTGLSVSSPAWTTPLEEYLSPTFEVLGPALDVTSASFPSSEVAPLLAYLPAAGHCLHRVTDDAGGDIAGATYDTSFHALDPADLGAPTPAQPSTLSGRALHTGSGLGVFRFTASAGATATVKVTPQGGAALRPAVWVATPGASVYAGGDYSWVPNVDSFQLGVVARADAATQAAPAQTSVAAAYDGIHFVIVRDLDGAATSADLFDVEVTISP